MFKVFELRTSKPNNADGRADDYIGNLLDRFSNRPDFRFSNRKSESFLDPTFYRSDSNKPADILLYLQNFV